MCFVVNNYNQFILKVDIVYIKTKKMKKILLIFLLALIFIVLSSLISGAKYKIIESNIANSKLENAGSISSGAQATKKEHDRQTETQKTSEFDPNQLYSLINSYRKENKLSPLIINQSLEFSAKKKVNDMIINDYFAHQDKNGLESWYMFKASGYEYKTAGENLSSGANTPWSVFEAWKNSQIHNEQLLSSTHKDMGIFADCESYVIAKKPSCIVVLHLGSK